MQGSSPSRRGEKGSARGWVPRAWLSRLPHPGLVGVFSQAAGTQAPSALGCAAHQSLTWHSWDKPIVDQGQL